jgi:hypothetical protein
MLCPACIWQQFVKRATHTQCQICMSCLPVLYGMYGTTHGQCQRCMSCLLHKVIKVIKPGGSTMAAADSSQRTCMAKFCPTSIGQGTVCIRYNNAGRRWCHSCRQ